MCIRDRSNSNIRSRSLFTLPVLVFTNSDAFVPHGRDCRDVRGGQRGAHLSSPDIRRGTVPVRRADPGKPARRWTHRPHRTCSLRISARGESDASSTIGVMDRRRFIKAAATAPLMSAALGAQESPQQFELQEATISSLQEMMRSRHHTARSITQLYLDRIKNFDRSGPMLRSMIELNPDVLKIADSLDQERKRGRVRGPLHGIPVLIKDNISTVGPMTTTAGSLALEGSVPPREAVIAKRLRDAGAIVIGKANLSEWANFRGSRSTSGWSARGGQCRNPYVLD